MTQDRLPTGAPAASLHRPSSGRLLQVLGVAFGLAVSIGNTIAAGIVRTPGEIATYLPTTGLFIAVWLVGGLYALLGANSVAELGTLVPRSGGQYVFARRALGPYAGFIVGWSDWISTCATNAAVAIVIGEYSSPLLLPWLGGGESRFTVPVAVTVILGFALLNWRGIRLGNAAQNFTSLLKALIFLGIVAACFLFGQRGMETEAASAAVSVPAGLALFAAFMLALQSVMYTYDGWTGPIYFSEEIRNPGRDIPRAMMGGALGIVAIYALFNLALLYILPFSRIAGEKFAMGAAAGLIFGPAGDTIARGLMVVCLLSGINAYVLMTSRVLFSMSRDGLFSARATAVNPGGTPTFSLALSTVVALIFLLGSTIENAINRFLGSVFGANLQVSGAFQFVINICAFFFVANYLVSFTAVFVLRWREPNASRPYRAWGHPWSTGLVWLASVGYLGGVIYSDVRTSAISLVLLALSYPAFRLMKLPRTR